MTGVARDDHDAQAAIRTTGAALKEQEKTILTITHTRYNITFFI